MAGFFGNGVTIAVDEDDNASFTTVGSVMTIQPPSREFDRVDFTVLGDSVQQMHLSPIMTAPEWEVTILMDRTQAEQVAIEGVVGDDTAHSWQLVFPWATLNTLDFEAKVFSESTSEIVSADSIQRTFNLVNTTTLTWS